MPSIRLNKDFLVFAISATVFFLSSSIVFSQVDDYMLREKAIELQRLINQKRSEGIKVFNAIELGRKSLEAKEAGKLEECLRLLEEAITLLKEVSTKELIVEVDTPKKIGVPNIAKKTVELPISTPKAFVTYVVPAYNSGKEISNYTTAFEQKVLEAKDGKITLELSSVPIIVEEENGKVVKNHLPNTHESSPFGIQGIEDQYEENFSYLPDLGVHWVRYAGRSGIVWDAVEPQKGRFDWSHNDSLFLKTYNSGINMVVTILTPNRWDQTVKKGRPIHKMPEDIEAYKEFLRKVVERYNGDGINDAPGAPVVKYWQIENEVDNKILWNDTMENYGELLKISYEVIKKADPSAKLLISGFTNPSAYYKFYRPLFDYLNNKYPRKRFFDIVDFHWLVLSKDSWKEQLISSVKYNMKEFIYDLRKKLVEIGYQDVSIWVNELSDYTGKPITDLTGEYLQRSEKEQAISLFKMHIYLLIYSVKKIFWTTIIEWHNWGGDRINYYFDNLGLIHNPRNNGEDHKKLSYYTYKLMVEKLQGIYFDKVEFLALGKEIYGHKFLRDDKANYVLWCE
jgi:hypothetical protein